MKTPSLPWSQNCAKPFQRRNIFLYCKFDVSRY